MLSVRAAGAVAVLLLTVAACGMSKTTGEQPDPNLASIRGITWTNSAQKLAGVPATSKATKAYVYGFSPTLDGDGASSTVAGDLVLSGVWTDKAVVIAAQNAKTGKIEWRRPLPISKNGYAECIDDEHGPMFACRVVAGRKAKLWIIADRTGAVRKRIPIDLMTTAYAISGDDVYTASFKPTHKDKTLEVAVERKSWSTGKVNWTRRTSFAIEGWGHDGASGFEIGKNRVVAYSASWQVVVDRATGRLLDRADQGRWETELSNGGHLQVDSGDGSGPTVDVTLFSPDGRPLSDASDSTYPTPFEIEPGRVVVGRRVLSLATGRTIFAGPKRHKIVAVADGGKVAVVEPEEFEFAKNRIPMSTYDIESGKKLRDVSLVGDWSGNTIASGHGAVKVVQHYDDKTDTTYPPTLAIFDVRRATKTRTLTLGRKPYEFASPTIAKTPFGVALTDTKAVHGLVVR